jgi:hypothetical protein
MQYRLKQRYLCHCSLNVFDVLISVRGWVEPRAIVRLEGLGKLKNPVTSSGLEIVAIRLITTALPRALSCMQICTKVTQDKGQWRAMVNMAIDFVVPQNSQPCDRMEVVQSVIAGHGLYDQGSVPVRGKTVFSTSSREVLWSTQPPIQQVPRDFPANEATGRVHSPPTRAEVKKMWIYTSTPPYAFMA